MFYYKRVIDQENTRFLKDIKDPHMREVTRQRLPSKESLKSAAWAAREVPSAPKYHEKFDLTLMNRPAEATGKGVNIGDYLLAHELDSGVILLGTKHLAKKFALASISPSMLP